jgi:hypothetical protein
MDQSKVYPQHGIHQETPLNINLNINIKRQDCKIGTVCVQVLVGGGKVKEGD